jgi:hypothetical protein
VWFVHREIDRACELSCDEAVIRSLDASGRQNYGDTLIYVAAESKTPRAVLSTTMCEDKKDLKERIVAIMKNKKSTRAAIIVSAVLIVGAVLAACALGAGNGSGGLPLQEAPQINETTPPAYDPDFEFRSDISVKTYPGRYTQSLSSYPGIMISVGGQAVGGSSLKYEAASGKFAVNDDGIIADLGNPAIREFGAGPSAHWNPDSNTKDGDTISVVFVGYKGNVLAQATMAVSVQDNKYSLLPTSKTPDKAKGQTLDEAVSQAILDTCYTGFESEGILLPAESHVTLKTVEDGDKTTVYAMAYETVYSFEGGKLREEGGSHRPVAITFEKTANGGYELLEYWVPNDGSYYRPSIQDKFPSDLWSKVDTQTYVAEQITAVLRTAQAYFGLIDHMPPTIQELAPLEIAKGSALDWSKYFSIRDNVDGEIPLSEAHIFDAQVDLGKSGDYSFQVVVKDNAGNENRSDFKMEVK